MSRLLAGGGERRESCKMGEGWGGSNYGRLESSGIWSRNFGETLAAVWIMTASPPCSGPALAADSWPTRPVTVICPFPPGISTDIVTRAVATALGNALGQQFVIENRPGANGNIGAGAAAKSLPDGYTFVVATLGPIVANKFMYKTMSYEPERAFAPSRAARLIAADHRRQPEDTAGERLRSLSPTPINNPGKLNAGTVGPMGRRRTSRLN